MRRAVVIGGGITGTLTTLELQRAGWSVTLLEAAHLGAGSSSRTAAGIRQQFSTPDTVRAMRYSVDYYLKMAQLSPAGVPPIRQQGYLFLHDDPARWSAAQQRAKMQHAVGLTDLQCLTQPDLKLRFPWITDESLLGATYCPSDGFLFPDQVYQMAAEEAVRLGATIRQNSPIIGATHRSSTIQSVQTPNGPVHADLFLDCTNAWSQRTARLLNASELPLSAYKRYLWFLRRDPSFDPATFAKMPLTITPSGTYCRPENPDILLIGHKHPAQAEPLFSYEDQDWVAPAFSHHGETDGPAYTAWLDLATHLPALGAFDGFKTTTSGYYASTPDHNPFLDFDPRCANLIRLVGFSGHGAMFGPFSARAAVALAESMGPRDSLSVPSGEVSLQPFKIERSFEQNERMVI